MPWVKIQTPTGPITAHIRMPKPRRSRCKNPDCRQLSRDHRLCDWKMPGGKDCDRPLCDSCTVMPCAGKDLCPEHAAAWAEHPKNQNRKAT